MSYHETDYDSCEVAISPMDYTEIDNWYDVASEGHAVENSESPPEQRLATEETKNQVQQAAQEKGRTGDREIQRPAEITTCRHLLAIARASPKDTNNGDRVPPSLETKSEIEHKRETRIIPHRDSVRCVDTNSEQQQEGNQPIGRTALVVGVTSNRRSNSKKFSSSTTYMGPEDDNNDAGDVEDFSKWFVGCVGTEEDGVSDKEWPRSATRSPDENQRVDLLEDLPCCVIS